MQFPALSHHGSTRGVTGSCHQLHLDDVTSLLIYCGLEQANDAVPGAEFAPIGFDVSAIKALIVTHVHLDHVGRIPALLAAGYRGPILCSESSAKLLPLVMEDAYKLGISTDPVQVDRYLAMLHQLILSNGTWWSNMRVWCASSACSGRGTSWVLPTWSVT